SLLNSYSEQLGKTFTAEDLTADPGQELATVNYSDLNDEQLAVFRAYLVLYGVNSIMTSLQSLEGVTEEFVSQVQLEGSPTREIFTTMVNAVVAATDPGLLNEADGQIHAGQTAMENQIRDHA